MNHYNLHSVRTITGVNGKGRKKYYNYWLCFIGGYKHGNQETAGIQLWYYVKVFKLNNNSCMHDHEELDSLSFLFFQYQTNTKNYEG